MFTHKCFIRKNTKELRDYVYSLGGRSGNNLWDSNINTLLAVNTEYFRNYDDEWGNADKLIADGYIDCGTNIELFKAIAAINNENDFMQWFICTESYIENSYLGLKKWSIGDFDLNTCPDYFVELPHWRKATLTELIEHFKE